MSRPEYFEAPLFVHVTDAGAISLEWCHGKQGDIANSKRMSIHIDSTSPLPQEARMADEVKRVEGWEFVVTRKRSTGCAYERHSVDLDFDGLRSLFLSQGLRIVGEAEMQVLEAMGEAELSHDGYHFAEENSEVAVVQAEFARRAAKGE